jgi:hypothetical protein
VTRGRRKLYNKKLHDLYFSANIIRVIISWNTKWVRHVKKAVPLQAWTGPEGSRKLRLPDFKTIGT